MGEAVDRDAAGTWISRVCCTPVIRENRSHSLYEQRIIRVLLIGRKREDSTVKNISRGAQRRDNKAREGVLGKSRDTRSWDLTPLNMGLNKSTHKYRVV